MARLPLAALAALAVALFGALALGEYAFDGWAVLGAGLLLGIFVAEAALVVAKRGSSTLSVISGALTAAGLLLAAWVSSGHHLDQVTLWGWSAVVLGVLAAAVRARSSQKAAGTAERPAPPA